jgi:hypothetical protein
VSPESRIRAPHNSLRGQGPPVNLVDIFARLWFALGLFIVFAGFLLIACGSFVFLYFHRGDKTQASTSARGEKTQASTAAPETDVWFYRQRHRRAVELLSDRVDQLNKELEAARQEIARLKGYRTIPNRE